MSFNSIKNSFRNLKTRFRDNSFDSLIYFVNIIPRFLGYSILKENIFVPFWIVHMSMLLYLYVTGSIVYQIKYAETAVVYIKSYVNVFLFIFVANNSYWFVKKRALLRSTLSGIYESDQLAIANPVFRLRHEKLVSRVKIILFLFFGCNMMNAVIIYVPLRINLNNDYAMTPCLGMGPLEATPNRQLCQMILLFQESTIVTVALSYQCLLLFLIAHTALLYNLLSEEIMTLNTFDKGLYYDNPAAKVTLPVFVRRHGLLLITIDKLKSLYSVPIGIDFAANAVCISLFFYLPFQEWLQFMPILCYCFIVFFLYCFLCQRLTNAAESFEIAVFSCGWENFGVKEKKAVYFMLCQAQKPVEILAADIIPVNIATFATTLQAMFKFVTVVKL